MRNLSKRGYLFSAFFVLGLSLVGCAQGDQELEISLGTDYGILIPSTAQSCTAKYTESKNGVVGAQTFDVSSKFFTLKRPRITWNNADSKLEIISIKITSAPSSAISVACVLSADEISILFGIPSDDNPAILDGSRLWSGVLYGKSTKLNDNCKQAVGNGKSKDASGAEVPNDCNYRQGSGLCNLICGGVSVAGNKLASGSATLTVLAVKTEPSGLMVPVKATTSITIENQY